MKHLTTFVIGLSLVVSLGGAGMPRTVHAIFGAGDIVIDPTNLIQNTVSAISAAADNTLTYILNGLAWQVADLAIESMTKSLVNWINSGFDGSPAFATDLKKNLQGVGDAVASRFFEELSQQDIAKTPHQDKVLNVVRLGYYLSTSPESFYVRHPSTINQVSPDARAFLAGDFSQGGWNAWFATVMNPQNNPYGAKMVAEEVLSSAIGTEVQIRTQELDWGSGFYSWKGECIQYEGGNDTLTTAPVCTTNAAGELSCTPGKTSVVSLDGKEKCLENKTETPGSVLADLTYEHLGAGLKRVIQADDFDEIISALLNQLVGHILGGNNGGLAGASRPSAGGGKSFLDTASSSPESRAATSGIGTRFAATVQSQIGYIDTFKAGWEKIRAAAQAALEKCGAVGNPTPQQVLDRAAAALVRAANMEASLNSILGRVTAAREEGPNQAQILNDVIKDYMSLEQLTPEELTEAQVESQDTASTTSGSLYSQMNRLATDSCTQAGN